jgi:hypothetical protein
MESQERPTEYDMYDIDCLDYGPYTPSETSLKSSSKAEEMDPGSGNSESVLSSRHSSPHTGSLSGLGSDYLVVDECLASDQEMTSLEEPPPQASRQVIDEGIYGRLASGDCTGSEATRPASTATRDEARREEPELAACPGTEAIRFVSDMLEAPLGLETIQQSGSKSKRIRSCPVCLGKVDRPRRHVMRKHFPWFWMPTTACWICHQQEAQRGKAAINHTLDHTGSFTDAQLHDWCQLVNGGLYLLAAWLKCDSLDDLLRHVIQHQLHQDARSGFTDDDIPLLQFYATNYSDDEPEEFTVNPPNHFICLINWELTSVLLSRVGSSRQEQFRNSHRKLTATGMNVVRDLVRARQEEEEDSGPRIVIIDSLFHF